MGRRSRASRPNLNATPRVSSAMRSAQDAAPAIIGQRRRPKRCALYSVSFALTYVATGHVGGRRCHIRGGNASAPVPSPPYVALFLLGHLLRRTGSLSHLLSAARTRGNGGVDQCAFSKATSASAVCLVFALGYMPAIKLSVALVHRLATSALPRFGQGGRGT